MITSLHNRLMARTLTEYAQAESIVEPKVRVVVETANREQTEPELLDDSLSLAELSILGERTRARDQEYLG